MNKKHIALYEYLMNRANEWTPQVQVSRDLFGEFGNGECCLAPKEYHDTSERHLLTKCIVDINSSSDFEKIIISSGKGIKIANEEEFDTFIKAQYKATIRKLSRLYKMAKKANRHGQIDFGGHTVESFLENLPETT